MKKLLISPWMCFDEYIWRHWLRICHSFFWKPPSFGEKFIWKFLTIIDYVTPFWRYFKYLRIVTNFRGIYCDCNKITNQAWIVLGHEQAFHSSFAYEQIRRKLMRLRRVTLWPMTIYGISPITFEKSNTIFFGNTTTFRTLTAQFLVLQPRGQLGYLNSNLMLRWDVSLTLNRLGGLSRPLCFSGITPEP